MPKYSQRRIRSKGNTLWIPPEGLGAGATCSLKGNGRMLKLKQKAYLKRFPWAPRASPFPISRPSSLSLSHR